MLEVSPQNENRDRPPANCPLEKRVATNPFRMALLVAIAIGIAFVLGKSLARPATRTPPIANFTFPAAVPLPQWQRLAGDAVDPHLVKPPAYISGKFVSGRRYRYLQNDVSLDIEMRYLVGTNGDLKGFVTERTGQLLPALRQHPERGFYSLFAHEGKAYLSACINSRGGSTVTSDRFNRNRSLYDVRLERILSWSIGEAELHDRRCLWAHLSMPLSDDLSVDRAYRTLESVWFAWYDWWSAHFPTP